MCRLKWRWCHYDTAGCDRHPGRRAAATAFFLPIIIAISNARSSHHRSIEERGHRGATSNNAWRQALTPPATILTCHQHQSSIWYAIRPSTTTDCKSKFPHRRVAALEITDHFDGKFPTLVGVVSSSYWSLTHSPSRVLSYIAIKQRYERLRSRPDGVFPSSHLISIQGGRRRMESYELWNCLRK